MDVRLKFPILRPLKLDDAWILNGSGAEMSFEFTNGEATAFVLFFTNQPTSLAPSVKKLDGPIKAEITINGSIGEIGRRIAQRFSDYINLYFAVPIDINAMEVDYIPANNEEREAIQMFGFSSKSVRPNPPLPFDMMAQAFYAVESNDDPSFASHMTRLAREALITQQYIDAFRFGFLLIEALYGNGKFQTRDLMRELVGNADFKSMLDQTILSITNDPDDNRSAAKPTIVTHSTADALVKHLLDRRGFYFHGNLKRQDAWHPDRQAEAKPVAEIVVDVAGQIAAAHASAMFEPDIGPRFMTDAKSQGAAMTIKVQFHFIDDDGRQRTGAMDFDVPGTKPTSKLAIKVNGHFLSWAEVELSGSTLLSARGFIKETGAEIFRTQFLKPADEAGPKN
ncbi:hypothetical protein [Brevundimonas sp.]|uniref:hypothetical protein n=1 Tax=Brevundimonas sp. TaxID=1871086 RepID=UPI0035698ABF